MRIPTAAIVLNTESRCVIVRIVIVGIVIVRIVIVGIVIVRIVIVRIVIVIVSASKINHPIISVICVVRVGTVVVRVTE